MLPAFRRLRVGESVVFTRDWRDDAGGIIAAGTAACVVWPSPLSIPLVVVVVDHHDKPRAVVVSRVAVARHCYIAGEWCGGH